MSIRRLLTAVVLCTGMIALSHSAASAQATPFFAMLLGGHEVSGGGAANAGDANAYGGATLIVRGTDTVCWAIVIAGLDTPNGAHIHAGRAGVNGPIRVTLIPPTNNDGDPAGNPGVSGGCVTDTGTVFLDTLRQIKANPALFYINVHSIAFPNGGVRGQLF
jgi:CHRD domain-containing protein